MAGRRKSTVAGAALVLALSGCAGAPVVPPPTAAASAAGGAGATPAVSAAAQTAGGKAGNPFPGYLPRKGRNGQMLYCREDEVAGTRIPKMVCATEDTLRNQSAESKQQVDDIRQAAGSGGCNPSMGC